MEVEAVRLYLTWGVCVLAFERTIFGNSCQKYYLRQ